MLGHPKYRYGDRVQFKSQQKIKIGTVAIVDAYGSWSVPEEPSYDISTQEANGPCLYKHVAERYINILDADKAPEVQ